LQTTISQAAALVIFGNDVLRGHARSDFWPEATVFRFCKTVRFVALSGDPAKPVEKLVAEDPMRWIATLKDAGTTGLRIHNVTRNDPRINDRMSVGFVGGGPRWLIETRQAYASDVWEARWQVTNREDPEKSIWEVTYFRTDQGRSQIPPQAPSLTALRHDLAATLSRVETFATRKKLEGFAGAFRKASAILSSGQPLAETHHSDLAPTPTVPLAAKQLLGAVQAAWVFGGMGSWNDQGFAGDDQQEYLRLSDELFARLNQSTVGAVNATSSAAGP
jgi:hypothetical protein